MQLNEELIQQVVDRILTAAKPKCIILFGSAAKGAMSPDSDLDVLVLAHEFTSTREENIRLRSALGDLGIPIDVFAMTPERFEETKYVIGGLAYPAHKYGKVIYEAA